MTEDQSYPLLIKFNPVLFKVLLDCLRPRPEEKILDLGCSQGFYVKKLEKYTEGIFGIDNDRCALEKAVSSKTKYGDALDLDFKENTFDKIYSLNVIEHIPDLERFFSEINKVLKPGGILILAYPWEPFLGVQAIVPAFLKYRNVFMAKKIHLHKLNPRKIRKLIKDTNFSHLKSKFILTSGFHYLTILKKS